MQHRTQLDQTDCPVGAYIPAGREWPIITRSLKRGEAWGEGPAAGGCLGTTVPEGRRTMRVLLRAAALPRTPRKRTLQDLGGFLPALLLLNWLQGLDNTRNGRLIALDNKLQMNIIGQDAETEKIHLAK